MDNAITEFGCHTPGSGKHQSILNDQFQLNNRFPEFISHPQNQNSIRLLEASYNDGVIYCRIRRDARSTVMGRNIDLINNKYHLLVASGSSVKRKVPSHFTTGLRQ